MSWQCLTFVVLGGFLQNYGCCSGLLWYAHFIYLKVVGENVCRVRHVIVIDAQGKMHYPIGLRVHWLPLTKEL